MSEGGAERATDHVQSLERGLAVIRAFDASTPEMTLSEVALATGLTRAAARRFLHTLVRLGYVRANGRLFSLRPRVLELGYAYLSGLDLVDVCQPHLENLAATVGESAAIAVLDGPDIVYLAAVPVRRLMTVGVNVGTRLPAHATSTGRVLLAALPADALDHYLATAQLRSFTPHTRTDPVELRSSLAAVRCRGWALVDQELEEGLRSIAAPVHDSTGQVAAAANLSLPAGRVSVEVIEADVLPHLLRTTALIEADLRDLHRGRRAAARGQ